MVTTILTLLLAQQSSPLGPAQAFWQDFTNKVAAAQTLELKATQTLKNKGEQATTTPPQQYRCTKGGEIPTFMVPEPFTCFFPNHGSPDPKKITLYEVVQGSKVGGCWQLTLTKRMADKDYKLKLQPVTITVDFDANGLPTQLHKKYSSGTREELTWSFQDVTLR